MTELLGIPGMQDLLGGVSRRAVIRWRDNGTLPPALKVGRLIRWRRSDIEKWIESGCVPFWQTQTPTRRGRQ